METDDTRWTFRPAIENFGVSMFKLAIRQPNYEFSKKCNYNNFQNELSNLNHFFPQTMGIFCNTANTLLFFWKTE